MTSGLATGKQDVFANSTQHIIFFDAKARNLKFFDDDRMSEIIITAWRNTVRCEETKVILLYLAFGDFSTMTGTLSGYFLLIFSPSALLFSKGCSSLYCIRSSQQLRHGKIPKIHKLKYLGLSKHSILGWDRCIVIFGVLIPATSWSWRCLASGWSLCGSVLVALGKC